MVLANDAIMLREIQANIIGDYAIFNNVHQVSLSALARILKRNQLQMKKTVSSAFLAEFREGQTVVSWICGGMGCWLYCSTVMLHTAHMNFWHVHWLYTRSILNYTNLSLTVFQRVL